MKIWSELTQKQRDEFTLNGRIRQFDNLLDDRTKEGAPTRFWSREHVDTLIQKSKDRESLYYGDTNLYLYDILSRYSIKDKTVGIVGSEKPWYEAICLEHQGIPHTIEYNKIETDDERLNIMTVEQYNQNPQRFDIVLSVSSIEHDGLGRYGDPIDPNGDFKAMQNIKNNMLKKDGLFLFAVPHGIDTLVWNAHRIYGTLRWPMLIEGYDIIDSAGFSPEILSSYDCRFGRHQPVMVLRAKNANEET